ncbi:MAG TPA: glycosyl hydrolase family 65 protein [Polyangiaceae bacterium]|nr:glycosyl hydrolase family 65 protein [Polyangiaceae bacterium]
MQKKGDRYLEVDPWRIVEKGFHKEQSRVSESLFCLSNENIGFRGSFEETYSGDTLQGAYFNGLYEEHVQDMSGYRGISNRLCFMVNCPHALKLEISIGDQELDLARATVEEFQRELDFKTGLLSRSFVWKLPDGRATRFVFRRTVDMVSRERVHQQVEVTPLNWSGEVSLAFLVVAEPIHKSQKKTYWQTQASGGQGNTRWLVSRTTQTKMPLFTAHAVFPEAGTVLQSAPSEHAWDLSYSLSVEEGKTASVHRTWLGDSSRDPKESNASVQARGLKLLAGVEGGFAAAAKKTSDYWDAIWKSVDIAIEGDPVNQQGIRFSMFQLLQCYSGAVPGSNIGAKGLTGEAYNGNAFWDTETYCLPFYLFTNAQAARGLIEYRHATLPQALERAKALDCSGACFPIATIDGTESCTLWQHASLQFQPTTAVVFAIQHYTRVTGDSTLLEEKGLEILLQASRFLASRVQYSENLKAYGYYGVMGPDEFQMMVNHNAYTNYMGKRSLEYALEALAELEKSKPVSTAALRERLAVTADELRNWREIAGKMFIPYSKETKLFEQHVGYFDLPHVDIDAIPEKDFPLYHSWSYDRIYRNDMIKQPDVLMFMLLYNGSFSPEEKLANYAFYEPRTIHESSLSPSVHSILAIELGRYQEAYNFFKFATRIDLDNYNRNTNEGLHTTALAAAWMNIVYGYGGLRSDGEKLLLNPVLPKEWQSLEFGVRARDSVVRVRLTPESTSIKTVSGPALKLNVWGKDYEIGAEGALLPAKVAS